MRSTLLAACLALACASLQAQWIYSPTPRAPRTKDGKVDMKGKVPRVNGKPSLEGVWQSPGDPRAPGGLFGIGESLNSIYFRNVLSDFPADKQPMTPAAAEQFRRNQAAGLRGNPTVNCLPDGTPHADLLPEPFKIIQTPVEIIMLYEVETTFRQVFMDGRKLPQDPSPSWMGYSVGRWEGDTLVINTNGFNDRSWLDAVGHPHTEEMLVEERFSRPDFGHLDAQVTITDPKMYTQPIVMKFKLELLPDTDVFEHYCVENERDAAHGPGR